jgi:predicted acyltransferase
MTQTPNLKHRLLSLDVFRGITVAAMILVNNPGDWGNIYAPLKHADWNGCTPTDLIFPFFLFIVGVSIVFALSSKKEQPENHQQLILSALKRSAILFGLGLFLSLFPYFDFTTVRILGVLQRIAIVYFFCAVIFIKLDPKAYWKWFFGILVAYWAIMTLIPVPDIGYANLGKETNLGAWIDRLILTENHIWKQSKTWDPEGILSTLPAIGTGLFGLMIGGILKRKDQAEADKIAWIFSLGTIAVIIGLIWDLVFPINKSLWTSSYVMYAGGLAAIGLALCYWLIDVKGYTKFTSPFVVYGVNAITVFFASGLIPRILSLIKVNLNGEQVGAKVWLYETFYTPYLSPYNASLAGAITFILIWWFILWLMYRKNIIIKV